LALVTVVTLVLTPQWGLDPGEARTAGFLTLIFGHLLLTFSARRLAGPALPNRILWLAVAASAGLQFLVLAVPPLRTALQLTSVPAWAIAWAVVGGVIAWGLSEAVSQWLTRSGRAP